MVFCRHLNNLIIMDIKNMVVQSETDVVSYDYGCISVYLSVYMYMDLKISCR